MNQKLNALEHLVKRGLRRKQVFEALPVIDGRRRGNFEFASIIAEQDLMVFSPDFLSSSLGRESTDQAALRAVNTLLDLSFLTATHRDFITRCVSHGVPSNVAILEGLPSTGRTTTLCYLLMILMLLDIKIVGTSRSESALMALVDVLAGVIARHEADLPILASLRDKIVCVPGSAYANEYRMQLLNANDAGIPDGVDSPKDFLSERVLNFVRDHPNDRDAAAFTGIQRAFQSGNHTASGTNRYLVDIVRCLHQKTLEGASLVLGTAFAVSRLDDLGFAADVVIIDDAGECTEPDALMAIVPHPKLKLMVLAADGLQLPPASRSLDINPLGNMLRVSLTTRLLAGYPHINRFTLSTNFRSHPNLTLMTSEVFGSGKLAPRLDLIWQTALNSNVCHLFNSKSFSNLTNGALGRKLVTKGTRQVFFDVSVRAVNAITDFVLQLSKTGVSASNVGIITMYQRDHAQLKQSLKNTAMHDAEVSSPERAFEGRSKKIVIIHFVAAANVRKSPFGQFSDPHSLCVATTRAEEYQFMFGDMHEWRTLLASVNGTDSQAMRRMIDYLVLHNEVVVWEHVRPRYNGY